jgi:hypothetical protein
MASTDRQRWARVAPALAWNHPGLPRDWYPVLERNDEAMNPDPLPGYVWLDTPGRPLHVAAAQLEFRVRLGHGACGRSARRHQSLHLCSVAGPIG